MSSWKLWAAVSVSLAGSSLLGSADPSTLRGERISLAGWSPGRSAESRQFQIRTSSIGPLYPGVTREIHLTFVNPNSFSITVRAIKGRFVSTSHAGCRPIPGNLQVRPYVGRLPLVIRPYGRREAGQVEVHMPNSVVDACQRARFDIQVESSATRSER